MSFLIDRDDVTVAVIGLGYVGTCIAATLASRGLHVLGVDIDATLIGELNSGHCRIREDRLAGMILDETTAGRLRVTTDHAAVASADVVLITVGTPIREDRSLADEQLRGACLELGRHVRQGQLVVLKSTVPPGTTRNLVLPLLQRSGLNPGEHFGLAFTPERLAEGAALRELRMFPVVVGGVDAQSTRDAARFWKRALGVEVITVDSLESAEVVKLANNWWIDLNVALANELAKFCALFDVDVLDVIAAANTITKGSGNINILLPSVGVGGSCLTKDPWMICESARRRGLEIKTAPIGREVNAGMPEYAAGLIVDELARLGRNPAASRVAVLGLAFKNNTGDLRATPTRGAIEALSKAGAEVRLFDPLVDADKAAEVFGIRPVASLREAVQGVDCLAILALHREFEDLDLGALPVGPSCLLVDGRAYFPKEKISSLCEKGYIYRGIGRRPCPAQ